MDREEIKPLSRNVWLWMAISGMVAVTLIRPLTRRVPDAPEKTGTLAAYSLVDQNGEQFGSEQLKGSVYVVNFFFSNCVTICPKLMDAVRRLHDRYEKMSVPVKLVSITVDPDNDTPKALKDYASRLGAKPGRWTFLTGTWEEVNHVIVNGFKTHMGEKETTENDMVDIGHGARLILVDDKGGIRGHYDTSELGLDELYHRSTHVLRDLKRTPACDVGSHLR